MRQHRNVGLIIHGHKADMYFTPAALATYGYHATKRTDIRNDVTGGNDVLPSTVINSECGTDGATAPDTERPLLTHWS